MANKTAAREQARRSKVEAMRADRARREAARRRRWIALGALGTVVVIVIALVAVHAAQGKKSTPPAAQSALAPTALVGQVTGVPQATLDAVGTGTMQTPPSPLSGAPALTADGKPRVVYVGAEYCPYCAAERWAVVQALGRFGTWSDLGQTASAADDVYPSTPTLSFHGATYSSDYLSFSGYEEQDVNRKPLDTVPADVQHLVSTYNKQGSIPFVDLGGKATIIGASYDPNVLQGKTHDEVAAAMQDPSTAIAKAVNGTANAITAQLCGLTAGLPANVCTSKAVTAARSAG
jgi:hypothetical protein